MVMRVLCGNIDGSEGCRMEQLGLDTLAVNGPTWPGGDDSIQVTLLLLVLFEMEYKIRAHQPREILLIICMALRSVHKMMFEKWLRNRPRHTHLFHVHVCLSSQII
jgi:hypothetical protein